MSLTPTFFYLLVCFTLAMYYSGKYYAHAQQFTIAPDNNTYYSPSTLSAYKYRDARQAEDASLRRYLEKVVYPEQESSLRPPAPVTNCRSVPVACFTDNDCRQLCNYNAVLFLSEFYCNKKNICRLKVNHNSRDNEVLQSCDSAHGINSGNILSNPYFLREQCLSQNRSLYTDNNVLNAQSNICQNSLSTVNFEIGIDGDVLTTRCECPVGTVKVHYLNYLSHIPHCVSVSAARLMTDLIRVEPERLAISQK